MENIKIKFIFTIISYKKIVKLFITKNVNFIKFIYRNYTRKMITKKMTLYLWFPYLYMINFIKFKLKYF